MNNPNDKIIVHRIDLGFNVDEEISKELKSKIDDSIVNEAKSIVNELNNQPSIIKKEENRSIDSKLDEIIQIIHADGKINKTKITEITGLNTISAIGKLRNFAIKKINKQLVKIGKDDYGLSDQPEPPPKS